MSRLWSVSHRHGFVTPADFVGGRYGSRALTVAVAVTGIVATMPYIALQLVGIKAVLTVLGLGSAENVLADRPAAHHRVRGSGRLYLHLGLRAPALIAVVKDLLIYLAVIVAVIYLPIKFGGWGTIFDSAQTKLATVNPATGKPAGAFIPGAASYSAYWTLALGSAWPCSCTRTRSPASWPPRQEHHPPERRGAAAVLADAGFLALLGYVAIFAGTKPIDLNGAVNPQLVVPQLFLDQFPAWFAGIALAAIAIGALVPAAIMSIAAANLFTRNIYRDLIKPDATPRQEASVSKIASLVVKFGALIFVIAMDQSAAINMQLLGGIWILQTFPAIVAGLYTRWFHRWALFAGWAAGIAYGTIAAYNVVNPVTKAHFGGSIAAIPGTDIQVYIAVVAFAINLVVAAVLSLLFRAMKSRTGRTSPAPRTTAPTRTTPRWPSSSANTRSSNQGGPRTEVPGQGQ